MNLLNQLFKITTHIFFVIIFLFFSTLQAKNFDKFNNGDKISNYFSGIILLNDEKYEESYKFLKKLDGLEDSHKTYSIKYLYSLVNSGNINQAFQYSKKIEKVNHGSFETDLIIGIYNLKKNKSQLATKYFLKASNRTSLSVLDNYISNSLYIWSQMDGLKMGNINPLLNRLDKRFENLKKIQKVFLNCFFNSSGTKIEFENLVSNEKTDFSRYNYFYANYLKNTGKVQGAKSIIQNSLKKYPRNLLLNQYKIDLEKSENNLIFNCNKKEHIIAEILYISANALSSQSIFQSSNFYLNLAKFLNSSFYTFDTLLAENLYKNENYSDAIKIYDKIKNYGEAFQWYSNKQISRIMIIDGKKDLAYSSLKKAYINLSNKGIYETFDFAEFLKNNEKFEESIKYYTNILKKIKKEHPLFPEVADSRGVAFERSGDWEKAEKDLLASLEASPNQAYVINYLAYSWIEQGVKIQESLRMLKKANDLRSNDPYIIDSLGWALFKLERYEESKDYLQRAVKLMPADPIVNDHYGDVLWKNGKKIQARYYWQYVLGLKKTEKDLKSQIQKKLIKGL